MWPRKKFWWEAGGTPPLQSPNPATTIPDDDPMFKWQAGMLFPTIPLETFDESKAAFSPIIPGANQAQIPQYDHTMGSSAGSAAPSGAAGSGKWKKVIEQLGKMTGPEPDWSLSAQNVGVRSPWSPTNVAWSPVGADMFGRKKKKGPY
tara:strand:- start:41 stop:484 length:444 start_codon:yes stop_codon:yes gene_type:complete